jgi:RND family efflux transporter MFP subunit
MRRRRLIILGAAVVVVAGAAFGYRRWVASAQTDAEEVQTAAVQRGTVSASIDAGGTLDAPQVETLSWGASGVVGSVMVAVGDSVQARETLMELDPDTLDASMIQAQAELLTAEADLADVLAGPSATELAQAGLRVANAQDALEDAQRTWTSQQEGNRGSSDTIAAAEASLVLAESDVNRAADAFNQVSGLPDDSPQRASALIRLVSARRARDSAARTLAWYTGHPTETQQALLDAEVATAEAELAEAQQALADLRGGPDQADVAAARARLAAAQEAVDQSRVLAPFDGTVVAISSFEGDWVGPNTAAAAVADLSHLQVSLSVSELEIGQITIGQEATITVDALPDLTVEGRVANVSIVGSVNQGVVTYPVTVSVDDPDPALQPGMTAAVSIITAKSENVLIVPNRAVRVSAGQNTVVVMYRGQQILVPVTLGLQGDSYSEVEEGSLQEGDEVVLNTSSTTSSQTNFMRGMGEPVFITGGGGFGPEP